MRASKSRNMIPLSFIINIVLITLCAVNYGACETNSDSINHDQDNNEAIKDVVSDLQWLHTLPKQRGSQLTASNQRLEEGASANLHSILTSLVGGESSMELVDSPSINVDKLIPRYESNHFIVDNGGVMPEGKRRLDEGLNAQASIGGNLFIMADSNGRPHLIRASATTARSNKRQYKRAMNGNGELSDRFNAQSFDRANRNQLMINTNQNYNRRSMVETGRKQQANKSNKNMIGLQQQARAARGYREETQKRQMKALVSKPRQKKGAEEDDIFNDDNTSDSGEDSDGDSSRRSSSSSKNLDEDDDDDQQGDGSVNEDDRRLRSASRYRYRKQANNINNRDSTNADEEAGDENLDSTNVKKLSSFPLEIVSQHTDPIDNSNHNQVLDERAQTDGIEANSSSNDDDDEASSASHVKHSSTDLQAAAGHHHGHHHGHYYQHVEVPKKKAWKFGFKRGNHKHTIERHEKGYKNKFHSSFKWHAKEKCKKKHKCESKGSMKWHYEHHDKKHHG